MSRLTPHLRYLSYVWRHKRAVYAAGVRLGVPRWRLIIHDWTKLLPAEWVPYVNQFYREDAPKSREAYYHNPTTAKEAFNQAWFGHCHHHRHHWQHWCMVQEVGSGSVSFLTIPMPETYVREMVADWCGAGAAQGAGTNPIEWYRKNRGKMTLHPDTRLLVDELVGWKEAA